MAMPFVVESPTIVRKRQSEFVLIGGNSEVQLLGNYTSKTYKMFWASEAQVNAKVAEVQALGWVLEGEASMTPIYPPLDYYNAEFKVHQHSAI